MHTTIKKLRIKKQLKQQDVAKYLGITLNEYRANEKEPHRFYSIHMIRLCELFEYEIKDLFDYEDLQEEPNEPLIFKQTEPIEYHSPEIDRLTDNNGDLILYKYRPFDDYVMDNIMEGEIYMPYVKDVNDPFETLSCLSKENGLKQGIVRWDPFVVASFSSINDSPVMWAHYGKNYTGVCFEVKVNVTRLKEAGYLIGKVTYTDDKSVATIDAPDTITQNKDVIQALFRKKSIWSYECEYRIFKQIDHQVKHDNDYAVYHTNGKKGKAMNQKYYLQEIDITRIIVGHHIRKADYTKIKSWSNARRIPLSHTFINRDNFRLDVLPMGTQK